MSISNYDRAMLRGAIVCLVVLVCILLFGTGVAHCEPRKPSIRLALSVYVAGQAADLTTTAIGLHSGRFVEQNQVLTGRPLLTKTAIATGLGVALWHMSKNRPTAARVSLYIVGCIGASAAVYNVRQLQSPRR